MTQKEVVGMKYEVVKYYQVEAESKEQAEHIIAELETKNQQNLFLRFISTHLADKDLSIWSLW